MDTNRKRPLVEEESGAHPLDDPERTMPVPPRATASMTNIHQGTHTHPGCDNDPERRMDIENAENGSAANTGRVPPTRNATVAVPASTNARARNRTSDGSLLARNNVLMRSRSVSTLTTSSYSSLGLPTVPNDEKGVNINYIDKQTVVDLIAGRRYNSLFQRIFVVDCRYPYEYAGGHVKGAIHIWIQEDLRDKFFKGTPSPLTTCIIFYCEFSQKRAIRMWMHMRELDRAANPFPHVYYHNIYVMKGGYNKFYPAFQNMCEPQAYVPQVDPAHIEEEKACLKVNRKDWNSDHSAAHLSRMVTPVVSPVPGDDETHTGDDYDVEDMEMFELPTKAPNVAPNERISTASLRTLSRTRTSSRGCLFEDEPRKMHLEEDENGEVGKPLPRRLPPRSMLNSMPACYRSASTSALLSPPEERPAQDSPIKVSPVKLDLASDSSPEDKPVARPGTVVEGGFVGSEASRFKPLAVDTTSSDHVTTFSNGRISSIGSSGSSSGSSSNASSSNVSPIAPRRLSSGPSDIRGPALGNAFGPSMPVSFGEVPGPAGPLRRASISMAQEALPPMSPSGHLHTPPILSRPSSGSFSGRHVGRRSSGHLSGLSALREGEQNDLECSSRSEPGRRLSRVHSYSCTTLPNPLTGTARGCVPCSPSVEILGSRLVQTLSIHSPAQPQPVPTVQDTPSVASDDSVQAEVNSQSLPTRSPSSLNK